jgi:hypothetical protein
LCNGIGHISCKGGSVKAADGSYLNPFGQDFKDAGFKWTVDLCNKDSDGDGETNGQELGDPCCTWSVGMPPALNSTYKLSHPGVKNDTAENGQPSAQQCASQRAAIGPAAAPLTKNQTIDTFYNAGETRGSLVFKCDPLPFDHLLSWFIYMVHAQVPSSSWTGVRCLVEGYKLPPQQRICNIESELDQAMEYLVFFLLSKRYWVLRPSWAWPGPNSTNFTQHAVCNSENPWQACERT